MCGNKGIVNQITWEVVTMRKSVKGIICLILAAILMSGCSNNSSPETTNQQAAQVPEQENTGSEAQTADGSNGDAAFEKHTIGVVMISANDSWLEAQKYMEEVIGPMYNLDFIFSEVINDAENMTTFVENAKASGADGIINNLASLTEQGAAIANDLDLYYVANVSTYYDSVADLPKNLAICGNSIEASGETFGEALKSTLNDDKDHNILLLSGAASLGSASAKEATASMLSTLKDLYGLTYLQDVNELAVINATTDIETGSDIKITIHPGVAKGAEYTSAVSALLQTGQYDVICSSFEVYNSISVAVDEVEKALGMNIKIVSQLSLSDFTANAFTSKDSSGDSCINSGVINNQALNLTVASAILRNAYDGYTDQMRVDGRAGILAVSPQLVSGADAYTKLTQASPSFLTEEEVKSLSIKLNPSCTLDTMQEILDQCTTDNVLLKFAE